MREYLLRDLNYSAATLRRNWPVKLSFIGLNALDLILTLLAFNLGFKELNPIMLTFLSQPVLLTFSKLILPVFIAWAIPGKWLWPAVFLMFLVIAWDIKELALYFFF